MKYKDLINTLYQMDVGDITEVDGVTLLCVRSVECAHKRCHFYRSDDGCSLYKEHKDYKAVCIHRPDYMTAFVRLDNTLAE